MKEIEVKVLNIDFDMVKKKLGKLGAKKIKQENQQNYFFSLKEENGYVRIRVIEDLISNSKKITLCIKKIFKLQNVRQNIEHEFEVSDFNECLLFLKELGFKDYKREDKYRESYILEDVLIEFDTWDKSVFPYPYIEIEAPNIEALERITGLLEIPKENITSKGLLEIKRDLGIL